MCIPTNFEHSCFVDEEHTSSIFLDPYNLGNIDPSAALPIKHTPDRELMSIQEPQASTHQPETDL